MTRFVVKRVLWGSVVLWVVSLLTFTGTVISPVDPVEVYAGRFATPEARQEIRREFKLDDPAPIRYLHYVKGLFQGNLGRSISNGRSVADAIVERLPATAQLALAAVAAELVIGLSLGIAAALRRGTLADQAILGVSLVGALVPVFVIGFLLLYLLAYLVPVFPIGGYGGLRHIVLPALALGLAGAPWYARIIRSTMLDVMGQEFVRAARARGASRSRIVVRHILPNSTVPIVAMLGLDMGVLLAGVLVIERVFAWPGIGQQAWLAVSQNDFPLIMGTVLVAATAIIVCNLLADVANGLIDPRVRRGLPA